MKTLIPISAIAALIASSSVSAQTPAYSKPSGYVTTTLNQGFNHIGLTLHSPSKASGDLEVIGASSVQDTTAGVNFTTSLGVTGSVHILEITSGSKIGLVLEISSWTTNTITTVDNLVTAGVLAGDKYRIRKAPTLEEIFTTNTVNGPLTDGSATTADLVYIPTGVAGQFTQYFLAASGAFRRVAPAALTPNVPIIYLDGLLVQRKAAGSVNLVVTGEVKIEKTTVGLVPGFNSLGNVFPVGSTVQNSGLENFVLPGSSATADLIYIPTTPGVYLQVFRTAGGAWRTVAPSAVLAADYPFKTGMYILRRGAAAPFSINTPSTWQIN